MLAFNIDFSVEEKGRKKPEYRIDTDLAGEVTLEDLLSFMKSALITISSDVLKEEQAKGFDKNPVVAVDGKVGKPAIDVKPFGKIEIFARQEAATFLLAIYEQIVNKSPIDTGLYIDSNYVFLNGTQIAKSLYELKAWTEKKVPLKQGDVIRFVNVMPYASKLERNSVTAGKTKTRYGKARDKQKRSGSFVRLPNGTYFLAASQVRRKFKFNSNIRFEWINGSSLDLSGVPARNRRGKILRKTFASRKGSYVYPSIVVRIVEKGVL